jgi:hypothetical protein
LARPADPETSIPGTELERVKQSNKKDKINIHDVDTLRDYAIKKGYLNKGGLIRSKASRALLKQKINKLPVTPEQR